MKVYEILICMAAVFAAGVLLGPVVIPLMRRLKFGQSERDDGPQSHLKKQGTPTMGGWIFLIPIVAAAVIC
ncbi:MAG: phospho-N-acetylmuramoyl-pentapeptide-transferase, partial [Clostridia bacterium]|nr:phospho-N-acetylmuramoyl-pentapeptide-transferase [Clostridia bacterium]